MIRLSRKALAYLAVGISAATLAFVWRTWMDLQVLPDTLSPNPELIERVQFLDRDGRPLSLTYQNRWNLHDYRALHAIPRLLQQAFIVSEDKRFYTHHGVDWLARTHAVWQNLKALRPLRGASTITEQVVRLLHPRARTLWSRWLEGIEAMILESRFSKTEIIEFYLNQVPYARQRRGLAQAARDYFDRDLSTLDLKETLALVVLVRAPTRFDLTRNSKQLRDLIPRLAQRMVAAGLITTADAAGMDLETFELANHGPRLEVAHFLRTVRSTTRLPTDHRGRVLTTLDSVLQSRVQALLDTRIRGLSGRNVTDGAVLVVDHVSNEILAWVNGGSFHGDQVGAQVDAITLPRQPGSTLKPFLYALALEKGWSAATLIDDAPLLRRVGVGLHDFHNYSHQYYGAVRLRDALANSLNTPAVRTMSFVNREAFLRRLHALGFNSLGEHPDHYGDGLALGNGEVTLLELVQAYATLAREGVFQPLSAILDRHHAYNPMHRIYSAEVSSLIADILSDPDARRLEFGRGHLLNFPVQTAIKTGTSNDYRDAWALGFSSHHTVGVWMGNLDQTTMKKVSGSVGPALVLRSVFAVLNRRMDSKPLTLSRRLQAHRVCRISGKKAISQCPSTNEWFLPDTLDDRYCTLHTHGDSAPTQGVHGYTGISVELRLIQPTSGLQMAMDPRIPDRLEVLPFKLSAGISHEWVEWLVNDQPVARTYRGHNEILWPLAKGNHTAYARVWMTNNDLPVQTPSVGFVVK